MFVLVSPLRNTYWHFILWTYRKLVANCDRLIVFDHLYGWQIFINFKETSDFLVLYFFKETTECGEHNIAYPDDSSLYLHFHHTPIQD